MTDNKSKQPSPYSGDENGHKITVRIRTKTTYDGPVSPVVQNRTPDPKPAQ